MCAPTYPPFPVFSYVVPLPFFFAFLHSLLFGRRFFVVPRLYVSFRFLSSDCEAHVFTLWFVFSCFPVFCNFFQKIPPTSGIPAVFVACILWPIFCFSFSCAWTLSTIMCVDGERGLGFACELLLQSSPIIWKAMHSPASQSSQGGSLDKSAMTNPNEIIGYQRLIYCHASFCLPRCRGWRM